MNADMIEYLANMERRVNKLADQIEELKTLWWKPFVRRAAPRFALINMNGFNQ